jgi:hypothetical protein
VKGDIITAWEMYLSQQFQQVNEDNEGVRLIYSHVSSVGMSTPSLLGCFFSSNHSPLSMGEMGRSFSTLLPEPFSIFTQLNWWVRLTDLRPENITDPKTPYRVFFYFQIPIPYYPLPPFHFHVPKATRILAVNFPQEIP